MKTIIFITALLAFPGLTKAQEHQIFITGNDLHGLLNSSDRVERQQAIGYVTGVFDALANVRHPATRYCFTTETGVTRSQAADIVRKHLNDNPGTRNLAAFSLASAAFAQSFPCRK